MQRILLLPLIILAFAVSACGSFQTVKDSWKYTKKQYRTYLNTPAEIDLEDIGSCELYELALSEAVIDVDEELQKLIRAMENSDHNPDQLWVMNIMRQVPWLSGVALIDNSGAVIAQYPEYFAKPFDASPLVEADPKQRLGALRAYVQITDAGPEIYLGNPVYGGQELRGIIVAYFDPRALVMASSDPGSFMLASSAGVLWPGRFGSGNVIASADWSQILVNESCGVIGSNESEFFWTTRYVGNLPLVYALPTSAGRESMIPGEAPAASERAASPAAVPVSGTDEAAPAPGPQPDAPAAAQPVAQPEGPAEQTRESADVPPASPVPPAAAPRRAAPEAAAPAEDDPQLSWPERGPDFVAPVSAPKPGEAAAPEKAPAPQGEASPSEERTAAEQPEAAPPAEDDKTQE